MLLLQKKSFYTTAKAEKHSSDNLKLYKNSFIKMES